MENKWQRKKKDYISILMRVVRSVPSEREWDWRFSEDFSGSCWDAGFAVVKMTLPDFIVPAGFEWWVWNKTLDFSKKQSCIASSDF